MECLDLSNIQRRFLNISGLSQEQLSEISDFAESGKRFVEQRLSVTPRGADRTLCEHYAACVANYDCVCARLSRDKQTVTSAGLYSSEISGEEAEYAKRLADNAKSRIAHLLKDESFVFSGV